MPYTIPTQSQVKALVNAHKRAVGAVNVRVSEIMLSIDVAYPNIPTEDFEVLRDGIVKPLVDEVVGKGMVQLWG